MTYDIGRRQFLRGSAGAVLGGSLLSAGCGVGQEQGSEKAVKKVVPAKVDGDLLIFNWTDYMDPKLIKGFEKQYGVKVRVANFDSMPSMMAKLRSGNQYDLIFPTADYVNRLVKANMLLQLDRDKLKNADGIYSFFDDPWYDAESAHTVPYAMYTTGIAWRVDKMGDLTGSWNDLAMEKAKGKTFMLDDFQEGIGQANLLNGFDLNTTDPAELDQSKATLEHQKEYLRGYSTNASPQLLSGTAWVHHAWNGDIVNTRNQAKNPENFKFETCKEGIPVGSDCMAIPSNAKSPGTALLFIDWILERGARGAERDLHRLPDADRRRRGRVRRSSSRTTRRSRSPRTISRTAASSRSSRPPARRRGTGSGRRSRRERSLLAPLPGAGGALAGLLLRGPARHHGRDLARPPGRARRRGLRLATRATTPTRSTRCSRPVLLRSVGYAAATAAICLAHRLPGGVHDRALRRPLEERADRRRAAAVPHQLPRAHVRVGGAALRRGPRQQRAREGHRLAQHAVGGDRRARLRLPRLHDPADLRVAGAHGPGADRGRQGPLRLAVADVLARHVARRRCRA